RILEVIELKELIMLLIEASHRSNEVVSNEVVLPRAGGESEITIIAVAKTLRDKNNHLMGVVTVLRDVTREKEINRMKANFLSTVSHELRTPLTSILSTYELLLQGSLGELNDDQYEFITLSKGQGEFLDIDIQPELPKILADEHKITRLFKNLLSNAVKFTEHGSIQLHIRRVQEGIQISVQDSGIGIPSEYFDKIFEKFFQVDSTSTREFGGSGAGLAICKAIVLAHHGRIWVESELNKGTRFHVILPFTPYNHSEGSA
ncbi:hypothetical protein CSA56_12990, partial [candidate division KSB3 bacterium]